MLGRSLLLPVTCQYYTHNLRQRRRKKKTHPETNLHNGPDDNRLAICVRAQVLDREDADDLDDCDEEAEAEEGCEEDLYRRRPR